MTPPLFRQGYHIPSADRGGQRTLLCRRRAVPGVVRAAQRPLPTLPCLRGRVGRGICCTAVTPAACLTLPHPRETEKEAPDSGRLRIPRRQLSKEVLPGGHRGSLALYDPGCVYTAWTRCGRGRSNFFALQHPAAPSPRTHLADAKMGRAAQSSPQRSGPGPAVETRRALSHLIVCDRLLVEALSLEHQKSCDS
jgi:hypothetical protein